MRLFALVSTHTDRHLAACARGLLRQIEPFDGIVVSSDRPDDAIPAALADALTGTPAHGDAGTPLHLAWRAHQGVPRLSQVRNNAVRALLGITALENEDGLVFIDGDIVLDPSAARAHRSLLRDAGAAACARVELDEGQTARALGDLRDAALSTSRHVTGEHRRALRARARRFRRAAALAALGGRRLGLVKRHKPKLIGCHLSVRAGVALAINGYDEAYEGYGFEDDDFSRRVHASGLCPRTAIGVERALALHLWHPTRKLPDPASTPAGKRFARRDLPVRAELGIDNPKHQPPLEVRRIDG